MIIRLTVCQMPNMREAYAKLLALEENFLKTHKRRNSVELTLASTSTPIYDERGKIKFLNEKIEIRAVVENKNPDQILEYEWFIKTSNII